jgi:amino acid transporter
LKNRGRKTTGGEGGRHLGLLDATLVGVGAIVGGGILALAGVAFQEAGPSAILAFALNGLIALVTALVFAEMAASFPESGGTYAFAKKVLSVEVAFMVGWVVWFASIVAAVLYSLGFSAFALSALERSWPTLFGTAAPAVLGARGVAVFLALAATAFYAVGLARRPAAGERWSTVGKVLVFGILIASGLWALVTRSSPGVGEQLQPFFAGGSVGLLHAMGYSFIALQGFDLIAAVGGEVRRPERNLPRAMLLSLALALVIYLPLLLCVATVGLLPGESIQILASENIATVIAVAAERFLGSAGWWLVVIAGVLSMLSALQANLHGASRVAASMAQDRTLPTSLGRRNRRGAPSNAVVATAAAAGLITCLVADLAAAGAAASLIFLLSFALAHLTSVLARRRSRRVSPFRLPAFPLIPLFGGTACLLLAVYQGLSVLSAGLLASLWLLVGFFFYLRRLAHRARVVDASAQGRDPELARLRGRSSFVLVPLANPARARALVGLAGALVPRGTGRVLLLSVVKPPAAWTPGEPPRSLIDAQAVLGEALTASFADDFSPEALVTIGDKPWREIGRVARSYRCASILLGLPHLDSADVVAEFELLLGDLPCDAAVLRAPEGWRARTATSVLIPVGGRRDQSETRARLLGHLSRTAQPALQYLCVLPAGTTPEAEARARRDLESLARDEVHGEAEVTVVRSEDPRAEVAGRMADCDLAIVGLRRETGQPRFGSFSLRLAREVDTPIIFVSGAG